MGLTAEDYRMNTADLDWSSLPFGYMKTDYNIRYTWRDGEWGEGTLTSDETIPIHIAATCLHYGQEAFEGLKAFRQRNGDIVVFRIEENAKRMANSARKTFMQAPPADLFIEAVYRTVDANRRFVPPPGTGAALYITCMLIADSLSAAGATANVAGSGRGGTTSGGAKVIALAAADGVPTFPRLSRIVTV